MQTEHIILGNLRLDGRKPNEIRDMDIQMNILNDSHNISGSAMLSMGDTKSLAWIIGPSDSKGKSSSENKGSLKVVFSIAPFANINRKKDYKRDLKMREFSKTLKDIFSDIIQLDLYQKSEICINVLILQNEGSYKIAAINSVTLALINAGILIKDTIVGASVGVYRHLGDLVLYDLNKDEEKENIPLLNVAFMPHKNKFIYLELLNAKTPYDQMNNLIKEAESASKRIFKVFNNYLKNYLVEN